MKILLKQSAAVFLILITWMSCTTNPVAKGDTSQTSLDFTGTYRGTTPCADCSGIETVLKLNPDNTYQLWTKYLGVDKGTKRNEFFGSGTFSWNKTGNNITLSNKDAKKVAIYRVQENKILQLDQAGRVIDGKLANQYVLRKEMEDLNIKEKYWKLVELMGNPIETDFNREPHLILKQDGKIIGNTGCNSFKGSYELKDLNRIVFSPMATTKMACEKDTESKFLKVLETADSYILKGEELTLIKGRMAPLAKFKVVYLK